LQKHQVFSVSITVKFQKQMQIKVINKLPHDVGVSLESYKRMSEMPLSYYIFWGNRLTKHVLASVSFKVLRGINSIPDVDVVGDFCAT
jgi:hypothetical protein